MSLTIRAQNIRTLATSYYLGAVNFGVRQQVTIGNFIAGAAVVGLPVLALSARHLMIPMAAGFTGWSPERRSFIFKVKDMIEGNREKPVKMIFQAKKYPIKGRKTFSYNIEIFQPNDFSLKAETGNVTVVVAKMMVKRMDGKAYPLTVATIYDGKVVDSEKLLCKWPVIIKGDRPSFDKDHEIVEFAGAKIEQYRLNGFRKMVRELKKNQGSGVVIKRIFNLKEHKYAAETEPDYVRTSVFRPYDLNIAEILAKVTIEVAMERIHRLGGSKEDKIVAKIKDGIRIIRQYVVGIDEKGLKLDKYYEIVALDSEAEPVLGEKIAVAGTRLQPMREKTPTEKLAEKIAEMSAIDIYSQEALSNVRDLKHFLQQSLKRKELNKKQKEDSRKAISKLTIMEDQILELRHSKKKITSPS